MLGLMSHEWRAITRIRELGFLKSLQIRKCRLIELSRQNKRQQISICCHTQTAEVVFSRTAFNYAINLMSVTHIEAAGINQTVTKESLGNHLELMQKIMHDKPENEQVPMRRSDVSKH